MTLIEELLCQLLRNQLTAYNNMSAYDEMSTKEFIKRIDETEALLTRVKPPGPMPKRRKK
jgi:hypothetical protein